ncbi:MAG: Hsp20/alpha crystallin family protein [Patescibacteria group bacterium]
MTRLITILYNCFNKMSSKEKEEVQTEEWLEDDEPGQLAIDAFQDEESVVIKAPIAGVGLEDVEISITDEVVTIKGVRHPTPEVARENYFIQECYWGAFTRSYILPVSVDAAKAEATLKDGILTVRIPKQERAKTRVLKVEVG